MHCLLGLAFCLAGLTTLTPAEEAPDARDKRFVELRDTYLSRYRPLWLESQAAWWEANTTGSDAAFARKKAADTALVELHGDRSFFAQLRSLKASGGLTEPLLQRQLEVMLRSFMMSQADPDLKKRIVDLENQVEQTFNTHRSRVGGEQLTENEVRDIVANTTDSAKAEEAWKAYMAVGAKVADTLDELVKLRNQVAGQLGYPNFYSMRLALQEIDEPRFFKLFEQIEALTRKPFAEVKKTIDARMAARFHIAEDDLRPWHFGDLFFQEAPRVDEVDLDKLFNDADLIALATKYYESMGLPCDDVIARSDLYEKAGKSPHAFSVDLDRAGDIRILCNLKPNAYWADTLLHELGHAVYDKYIDRSLPFLLREPSHSITTEGIAMMFGAMSKNEDWLRRVKGVDSERLAPMLHAAREAVRAEKLLFSRWALVMVHFEHQMYSEPSQDLGALWWKLKKQYQLLPSPVTTQRPDYAAKIHVLMYPVYYHSYLMGDLFAAQVRHHIARTVLGLSGPVVTSFYKQPEVGEFLREKVFGPGDRFPWDELTKRATGEPLSAKYFVQQYVNE